MDVVFAGQSWDCTKTNVNSYGQVTYAYVYSTSSTYWQWWRDLEWWWVVNYLRAITSLLINDYPGWAICLFHQFVLMSLGNLSCGCLVKQLAETFLMWNSNMQLLSTIDIDLNVDIRLYRIYSALVPVIGLFSLVWSVIWVQQLEAQQGIC